MKKTILTIAAVALLAACTATGEMTPQAANAIKAACVVENAAHPVLVSLTAAESDKLRDIAAVEQAAHPLVQAACAAAGGVPVGVTSGGN